MHFSDRCPGSADGNYRRDVFLVIEPERQHLIAVLREPPARLVQVIAADPLDPIPPHDQVMALQKMFAVAMEYVDHNPSLVIKQRRSRVLL